MQISAITPNYNYSVNNNMKRNNVSQPSFQGGLNKFEVDIVLQRLAKVNDEVFESFSMPKLREVMDYLVKRYDCLGIRSCGIQIVGNDDLPKLLGKDAAAKYDLTDKIGLCVAVGDKYGPIEQMTNIYQAKTFLLKPSELNKLSEAVS
jgi:hypothetical protein